MKKFVIIKMEAEEANQLEKWIKNSRLLAEKLNNQKETIEKFKKFEKAIKNRKEEPTNN